MGAFVLALSKCLFYIRDWVLWILVSAQTWTQCSVETEEWSEKRICCWERVTLTQTFSINPITIMIELCTQYCQNSEYTLQTYGDIASWESVLVGENPTKLTSFAKWGVLEQKGGRRPCREAPEGGLELEGDPASSTQKPPGFYQVWGDGTVHSPLSHLFF